MRAIISAVKAILNGFTDLINFIQTCFKFLYNFGASIVFLIKYLLQCVNISTSFFSTLPAWLLSFASITFTVCLLYQVLGRSGGAK